MGWWKFADAGDENEAAADARRAVAAAVEVAETCDRAVLVFEDVNRLPPAALRLLEPLTEPVIRSGEKHAALGAATVVFTSDLYAGPSAADAGLLEPGMAPAEARAVAERQARKTWGGDLPDWCTSRAESCPLTLALLRPSSRQHALQKSSKTGLISPRSVRRWTRDVATHALPPLDARGLDAAVELYLRHDVGAAVRDALRFRFAELRVAAPGVAREWTGAFSYDDDVRRPRGCCPRLRVSATVGAARTP